MTQITREPGTARQSSGISVVIPMFNDWDSAQQLLSELDALAGKIPEPLSIVLVNDGSSEGRGFAPKFLHGLWNIGGLEMVNLVTNLGSARAIAVGLAYVGREKSGQAVIVMDCDGEDRAEDVPLLMETFRRDPSSVVVAHRSERSEGLVFRGFYQTYKALFRFFTGHTISFGNFCLIPWPILQRLIFVEDLWNHLGASLVRSRLAITKLPTRRGRRYSGSSKMNLVSLVQVGLGAIAVELETVLVRVLLALVVIFPLVAVCMGAVVAIRLGTDLAIPGWASTVFGALALLLVQLGAFSALLVFVNMKNRAVVVGVPALYYRDLVVDIVSFIGPDRGC